MTLLDILPSLRGAMRPRIDTTIWPSTTQVDALGRLCVGSVALTDVADEFGTPAYVLDEADVRGPSTTVPRCGASRWSMPPSPC